MKSLLTAIWLVILAGGVWADVGVISPVKVGVAYPSPDGRLTATLKNAKDGAVFVVRGRGLFGRRYPVIGTDERVRAILWSRDGRTLFRVVQYAGPETVVELNWWDGHQWQERDGNPTNAEEIRRLFAVSLRETGAGIRIGYVGFEKHAEPATEADIHYYRYDFTVDPVTGAQSNASKKEIGVDIYGRLVHQSW